MGSAGEGNVFYQAGRALLTQLDKHEQAYTDDERRAFGLDNLVHMSAVRAAAALLDDEPELKAQLECMSDANDDEWLGDADRAAHAAGDDEEEHAAAEGYDSEEVEDNVTTPPDTPPRPREEGGGAAGRRLQRRRRRRRPGRAWR